MDGTMYCKISKNELKQSMTKLPGKTGIIFQHDLAPWHTSNIVKDKIAKMKLNVLDWPSKNADLNPIEILWSILDKKTGFKTNLFKIGFNQSSSGRMEQY